MFSGNIFGAQPDPAGIYARQVLQGSGPPRPNAGRVGEFYIDTVTGETFAKKMTDNYSNWGFYQFITPLAIAALVKWQGHCPPYADIGVDGDYYFQFQSSVLPVLWVKAAGAWTIDAITMAAVTVNLPCYNRLP